MPDDMTLLGEYSRRNSEEAFAALVSRHVNLVYSVALREVHDPHLAEDITQAVFVILARKAESFNSKIILGGWLCRTARYASANALTILRRRQRREQEAHMQSILNEPETGVWMQIGPLLGGAMEQLGQKDHDAVVLRFFEGKSFQEIGTALGATENAAKKRVAYALEKLRTYFSKHGVTSTSAIIAVVLSTNSVQAAPVTLAKAATAVAVAKGAMASASTLTLIKEALKIMAWTKAKTAITAGVVVLLVTGTTTTLVIAGHQHQRPARSPLIKGTRPGDFAPDKISYMTKMGSVKATVIPAFIQYAKEHDDDIPASMADLQPYLPPDTNGIGYDNWEILATGKFTPQLEQHDTILFQQKSVPAGQYLNLRMVGYTDGHLTAKK